MKLKTVFIVIFLVIGLLGVPNYIFAQQYHDSPSDTVLQSNLPALMDSNGLVPQLKGGRGGGSSSGASKAIKKLDDDDDDVSGDDGGSWWIVLIVIVIIAILVWYFFLRK